jgi:hypothetical protein
MGGGGGSHRVSPDTRLAKYGRPLTGSIAVSHPGGRGGGVGKPGVIFMVLYLLLPIHYFSSLDDPQPVFPAKSLLGVSAWYDGDGSQFLLISSTS